MLLEIREHEHTGPCGNASFVLLAETERPEGLLYVMVWDLCFISSIFLIIEYPY